MGMLDRLLAPPERPSYAAHAPTTSIESATASTSGKEWELWRKVGELNAVTWSKANQVARGSFEVSVDGRAMGPEEAAETIEQVTWPDGARLVVARMVLHMEVVGRIRYGRLMGSGHWQVIGSGRSGGSIKGGDDRYDVLVSKSNRDPDDPSKTTSAVKAAEPILTELVLLQNLGRAVARSSVAQRKILLTPSKQELSVGDAAPDPGELIEQAFTAPIVDERSAAAVAPLSLHSPSEVKDGWAVLDLSTDFHRDLPDRVDRLLRRLALSMHYPPEKLLGNMSSNHWNAWLSSMEASIEHVEPAGWWPARILELALEQLLGAEVVVMYVPPEPLSQDTAPSMQTADRAAVAALDGTELGERLAKIDEDTLNAGRAMVEAAMLRTREKLGARVRSAITHGETRDETLLDEIDGVDNGDVAAALGLDVALAQVSPETIPEDLDQLAGQWTREVDRTWDRVGSLVDGLSRPTEADSDRDTSAAVLVQAVAAHVLATLDRTTRNLGAPPMDAVRRALAIAGGNGDPQASTAAVGHTGPETGIATGRRGLDAIERATGLRAAQWRWVHDDPANPHPEHQRLSGKFTTPDGTATTRQGWTAYPGDHAGCLCSLAPVLR